MAEVQTVKAKEVTCGIDLGQQKVDKYGDTRIAKERYLSQYISRLQRMGELDGKTKAEITQMVNDATDALIISRNMIDEYFEIFDPLRMEYRWEERENGRPGPNPKEIVKQ